MAKPNKINEAPIIDPIQQLKIYLLRKPDYQLVKVFENDATRNRKITYKIVNLD